ncbi:MAG: hypothetical protein IJI58_03535 [Bacilli bacterium]|nr:hypothetical protein [Bacilli bacterium]
MKKIIYGVLGILLIAVLVFVFTNINFEKEEKGVPNTKIKDMSVLDHDYYKGLTLEDIISVTIIKYSEGGANEKTYNTEEDIKKYYNYWKNKKLGKETNQTCDDNTTTYIFMLKDNASISIEKECDWIIINNKRYLIN